MNIAAFIITLSLQIGCQHDNIPSPSLKDSISDALTLQLDNYPESQLRDVYKNFMQDFFGPGHILSDTSAADRYLRKELEETEIFGGPLYEKTGYKGNFYRVNISLIHDGTVPYDQFFESFTESIRGITPPKGTDWMKTWEIVDSVIKEKGLTFNDEVADREDLEKQFEEGNYIVHHSRRFNENSNFHYRIMSREKFETEILPLLQNK